MLMLNVKEVHPLGNRIWVLFCDLFNDDLITDNLNVGGMIYKKPNFEIEQPKVCFSPPTTRNIVLFTEQNCSQITSISFV